MRWMVSVILASVGCGPTGPAPLQDEIGDICRSAARTCIDTQTIRTCHEERWAHRACDEICAEHPGALASRGCMADPDEEGSDSCVCEPASGPECIPGEATCLDPETLSRCTEHAIAEVHACASICADGPVPLRAEDCEADAGDAWCNCTVDGVPCDVEGMLACADDDTLATCMDGEWMLHECADECGTGARARCRPAGDPPVCEC